MIIWKISILVRNMISIKYKNVYEKFIKLYEEIHVNPWHNLSKWKLQVLVDKLVSEMEINDIYSFKYFIDYVIKRLSGIQLKKLVIEI